MPIFRALEIEKDGKPTGLWRYTRQSLDDPSDLPMAEGACAIDCLGHKTETGAIAHYWEGRISGATFHVRDENNQRRCVLCGAWTNERVRLNGECIESLVLCEAHQNFEHAILAIRKGKNLSAVD